MGVLSDRRVVDLPMPAGPAVLDTLPALLAALDGTGPALRPVQPRSAPDPLGQPTVEGDVAFTVATSGSTGTARHALLTAAAVRHAALAGETALGTGGDWLLALPATGVGGLMVLIRAALAGQEPRVLDTEQPFTVARFAAAGSTVPDGAAVSLVPTQLHRLLVDPAGVAALQRFAVVMVGGAALPFADLDAARRHGIRLVRSYGMTETCGGCVYDGQPLPGVRVDIDDGRLRIRGPLVATGYLGVPYGPPFGAVDGERTFTTGDTGTVGAGGTVAVTGRADDMLISGGVNVAPLAVEDALSTVAGVSEIGITAVPDAEWGQAIVAVVVASGRGPDLGELRRRAAVLQPAAAPRHLLLVDALPTRGPGKLDRRRLAELAAEQLRPDRRRGTDIERRPARRYLDVPLQMNDEPVDALLDWATAALADAGYRGVEAPDVVRRRSWSIVMRLPTDRGPVWAKANAREFAYEAALLQLLDEHAPGHVLPPIALRADRGWLLSPDGGTVLDDAGHRPTEQEWHTLFTGYADLQRRLAPRVGELREMGLLDCSPPTLPEWYRRALARADQEPHVAPLLADRRDRLTALLPATRRWAAELAASPIPLSVEHNDLHADNVFVGTAALPGLRIFDWGDATITHPFTGLRRALLTAAGTDAEHAGGQPAELDVDRLRDAYLAGWLTCQHTVQDLRRDADLSGRLSWIVLAASWLRLPVGLDEEFAGYYAEILTGYLAAAAD